MKIVAGATPNQFVVEATPSIVGPALERAINSVGKVTSADHSSGVIKGWGKYGLNKVKMSMTLSERDGFTLVTVSAKNGSVSSSPSRSVVDRVKDALANDGVAGYEPDRVGMSKSALIGSVIAVAIIVFVVLNLLGL